MTALPARNPYRPGAAIPPLYLAGRAAEKRRFRGVLNGAPELPANVRLTGLRGVGKTVLLKEFADEAERQGWIVRRLQLEPRHNTEAGLERWLVAACDQTRLDISRKRRVIKRVKGVATGARGLVTVSYEDFQFSLSPGQGDHEVSLVRSLFETLAEIDEQGHSGFMLMLDEAQVLRDDKDRLGEHPLSLLVAAINSLQEAQLPMGLVLCGLPTLRANLLRARTNSERMFRGEEIGSLPPAEAREAFVRPLGDGVIQADDGLIARVLDAVEGYPFFIQLWGSELWTAAHEAGSEVLDGSLLDTVEVDIYRRLDADFYEGRVEALTPAEQDLLMATASPNYPRLRTADIHVNSGKSEGNVNVLMGRLTDQGVVYRVSKGLYEYTAPKFHDFLLRRKARLQARIREQN